MQTIDCPANIFLTTFFMNVSNYLFPKNMQSWKNKKTVIILCMKYAEQKRESGGKCITKINTLTKKESSLKEI